MNFETPPMTLFQKLYVSFIQHFWSENPPCQFHKWIPSLSVVVVLVVVLVVVIVVLVIDIIKPALRAGFSRIKNIPYQAPATQLGPKNVHCEKTHFRDPNINARI